MTICNVCKEKEAVGTCCSATGAVSFSYCAECLQNGREPYFAVVASLFGMKSMDEIAKWYRPIVTATLKAEGKTEEELFEDVITGTQEYLDSTSEDNFFDSTARESWM